MERHITRSSTALIATAVISLGLAACSTSADGDSTSEDAPIELTLWHGLTGPDGPAFESIVSDFNASQERVVINSEVLPWDSLYQMALTSAAASDGPDIITMSGSRLSQYASRGALASADDFYADDTYMDTSPIADGAIAASVFDGTNYGVPLNLGPVLMYWNKEIFDEAGLDPDAPPTTWDQFEGMIDDLTLGGDAGIYPIAIGDHATVPIFPPLLWNGGGGVVSQDGTTALLGDDATISAAEYWVDLVRDRRITPVGMSGADADQLFQSGLAALTINGPWLTTGLTEAGIDFGVTRPFTGPADDAILGDVVSFTLSSSTTDVEREAAYEFFTHWLSVESQATWANGSGFPAVRTDMPEGSVTNEWAALFGQTEILDSVQPYLTGVANAGEINEDLFTPALQSALNGSGEVANLFTAASLQIQAVLDAQD